MFGWLKRLMFTSGASDIEIAHRANTFRKNGVHLPKNLKRYAQLKNALERRTFMAPRTVDLRDYCPPTGNQRKTPYCAAFTASHWASNIKWRIDDYLSFYDAEEIYKLAKQRDGIESDGTSLTAVLEAIRDDMHLFNEDCEIYLICDTPNEMINQVKYAVHKFGCVLGAFNITSEWYACNEDKDSVEGGDEYDTVGGHAVLICGYNKHGVIVQNSWGEDWGEYGYAIVKWDAFKDQFVYGAVLTNCLNNLKMN